MMRNLFFVFGIFVLFGISFLCNKEREYNNPLLGLLILWSLTGVFIHSFRFSLFEGNAKNFLNFAVLSEGFIYVLCGCILYYLTVSYSRKFNIIYPVLAINVLNFIFVLLQKFGINPIWSNVPIPCGMMGTVYQLKVFSAFSIPLLWHFRKKLSLIPIVILLMGVRIPVRPQINGLVAIYLAIMAYFFFNKIRHTLYLKKENSIVKKETNSPQWERLSGLLFIAIILVFLNREILWVRLLNRLELYTLTLKEIIASPVWGYGFSNSLMGNTILTRNGWALRQNDYLNIARDLGIPFLVILIILIKNSLKNRKKDYLWVASICLMISCFIQTSMYYAGIAVFGIIFLALKEKEGYEAIR